MSGSIRSATGIAAVAVAVFIAGIILWRTTGGWTDFPNVAYSAIELAPLPAGDEFQVDFKPTQVRTLVPTATMTPISQETPMPKAPIPKKPSHSDGELIIGTIHPVLEVDRYEFSWNADDKVLVRIVRTSKELSPQFKVYHPDSTIVCSSIKTRLVLVESECSLPVTGTYSVLVSDQLGTQTGDYVLTVNHLNHSSSVSVNLGEPVNGVFESGTEIDQFSFEGEDGIGVVVRMVRTSGDLSPQFRVYRPDGTLLCGSLPTNFVLVETECSLNESGTYNILVSDYGGSQQGGYALSIQRSY